MPAAPFGREYCALPCAQFIPIRIDRNNPRILIGIVSPGKLNTNPATITLREKEAGHFRRNDLKHHRRPVRLPLVISHLVQQKPQPSHIRLLEIIGLPRSPGSLVHLLGPLRPITVSWRPLHIAEFTLGNPSVLSACLSCVPDALIGALRDWPAKPDSASVLLSQLGSPGCLSPRRLR